MKAFQKSRESFPIKESTIYLNHCGIAPLYSGALRAQQEFSELHMRRGIAVFAEIPNPLTAFHEVAGRLLTAPAEDISFMKNTAEGLSLIAAGYDLKPGDEIISYVHEYPSNHYPWRLQERRGARLVLLDDVDPTGNLPAGCPRGWSLEELASRINERTRIVALSHVQFTSGFAADLPRLAELCRARGVDLIIDAAQSLGCLPIDAPGLGLAAVAASGWKWLMGPIGTGLLYTSPQLRSRLNVTLAGADIVQQGDDYLNHTWKPFTDGRMFEYSTAALALTVALRACIEDLFLEPDVHAIQRENLRLQDRLLERLNPRFFQYLRFALENRSGIMSFRVPEVAAFVSRSVEAGVFVSARGGYLRIAPHFCNTDEEIDRAAAILNKIAGV